MYTWLTRTLPGIQVQGCGIAALVDEFRLRSHETPVKVLQLLTHLLLMLVALSCMPLLCMALVACGAKVHG